MSVCWYPSPTPKGWSRGESSEGYMVSIVQGLGFRVYKSTYIHIFPGDMCSSAHLELHYLRL